MIDAEYLRSVRERVATDPHAVTYRVSSRGANALVYTDYAMSPVYRKKVTVEDLVKFRIEQNIVPEKWRIWQLWREVMEGVSLPEPKTSDIVLDDGVSWVVYSMIGKMMGEVVNCLCYRTT